MFFHFPENHVRDEAVGQGTTHQRCQLSFGLVLVQMDQGDSMETGIPEPLEWVPTKGRANETVVFPIPLGYASPKIGEQNLSCPGFQLLSIH